MKARKLLGRLTCEVEVGGGTTSENRGCMAQLLLKVWGARKALLEKVLTILASAVDYEGMKYLTEGGEKELGEVEKLVDEFDKGCEEVRRHEHELEEYEETVIVVKNVDFIEVLQRMTKDGRLVCKSIDGECARDMECAKEDVPGKVDELIGYERDGKAVGVDNEYRKDGTGTGWGAAIKGGETLLVKVAELKRDRLEAVAKVEEFFEGKRLIIEHHPHAKRGAMLMEDMAKEDIEKCGKDIKLFNEIIDLEGYNYLSTFKWLCMLRRVVKRPGWTAGYSLKLGNLYMAAALPRSVPMEEIREVTKHAHEADVDAHMAHVVAAFLIEAVQAILKDGAVGDDRMHDMGNGIIVKISEGVVVPPRTFSRRLLSKPLLKS